MDLSIIICNLNTAEYLRACIESINRTMPPGYAYEIIVVDNGSTDGSVEMLQSAFPEILLIVNGHNLGFPRANNQGVVVSRGRYVLFLNQDTIVREGTLATMLLFMDGTPEASAATCYLELPSGLPDDGAHRGFPTPWSSICYFSGLSRLFPRSRLLSGYTMGGINMKAIHEIDALVGAFMLIRREAGEEVGWWDEDYFFYGDDLEFCYQLRQRGRKIFFVPQVSILHFKGAAAGVKRESQTHTVASREMRRFLTHCRFESMRIFYRKHYWDRYPRALRKLVFVAIGLKERWSLARL